MITLTVGQSLIAIVCVCVLGYACGKIQRVVAEMVDEWHKEHKHE